MEEPSFLKHLHKIREELSSMPTKEYEEFFETTKKKYHQRLGHLYTELAIEKSTD